MKRSEAVDTLAEALAKAQGQMEGAVKSSLNPFYKSKYADLASVWSAIRKPLSDNGLAVVQAVRCEYGADKVNPDVAALAAAVREQGSPPAVIVTTLLMHNSGQWIEEELTMWPRENTPQAIGTCASYARRYGLAGMVGVYQEDDDAERSMGRGDDPAVDQDVLAEYLKDLVNAIKTNDIALARNRWNELNVTGTTSAVWRALNTKQKAALRQLLQATSPTTTQTPPETMTDPAVEQGDGE